MDENSKLTTEEIKKSAARAPNRLPPAFIDEGVKSIPYVPSEKDREICRWARIAFASQCSGSLNCASCSYHPQDRSSLWKGKKS